ncbi:MAG: hypothetical protein GX055_08970 [Desulfovibrionales bacterium]|nr:hypothetical protein [Desulfovibrionales bacterium]
MNGHGALVVTALFSALLIALVGFGTQSASRLEAAKIYEHQIAALESERNNLLLQIEEIQSAKTEELIKFNDAKIKDLTITAYSPTVRECGPDPHTTASMRTVRPGFVAVSRDLFEQGWKFGKKVYVKGHGIFEIADLMAKRHTKRLDIFIPNTEEAIRFGKKQTTVALLEG